MDSKYLLGLINEDECEWIEYKENLSDKKQIGEYISAMSNAAAYHGADEAYLIWGVQDKTKKIVGTSFNYDVDIDGEPLKHYLARLLNPSVSFKFETFCLEGKKVVCLTIPAARRIMTEFNKERYIRIGSSKELLRRYPEREIDLAVILKNGVPTIINTPSNKQNLHFTQLKSYYVAKGAYINEDSFEENVGLFVPGSTKFNEMAYLLSDENDVTCRVSIFSGTKKSDNQYSLNDFGRKCMLITMEQMSAYLESLNIVMTDETSRVYQRKDVPLFDTKCLKEALLNAFIHNDWVDLNAPMVSVFEDRIEIISNGGLPPKQTKTGFFMGRSKPRCIELSEIFIRLRISERSGRGVNRICQRYGEEAFFINEEFIKVTIPFEFKRTFGSVQLSEKERAPGQKKTYKKSEETMELIVAEMRNNASVTISELIHILGLGKSSIQNYIKELSDAKRIERVGSNKSGHWKVND